MLYTLRIMRKHILVSVIAILSIAFGIGSNVAVFGLIEALFLHPLPVNHPEQLVALTTIGPDPDDTNDQLTLSMIGRLRKTNTALSGLAAWDDTALRNIETGGIEHPGGVVEISGDYFDVLGVHPLLGRLVGPADVPPNSGTSARVAVLDYRCWQTHYGADPQILGKDIKVDGVPLVVIGVAPKQFGGLNIDAASDAYVPLGFSGRRSGWYNAIGRLRPEITLPAARAQIGTLWPSVLQATVPQKFQADQRSQYLARKVKVEPMKMGTSFLRSQLARPLAIILGLAVFVLLVGCVNLASITLARAATREHELGIRVALGAGKWNLVRLQMVECSLISSVGAGLGLALASGTGAALLRIIWLGYIPLTLRPSVNLRVFGFTLAAAVLCATVFGLLPVLHVLRKNPVLSLRSKLSTVKGGARLLVRFLIAGQAAFSVVLVTGAVLFALSLFNLRFANPGFDRHNVLTMELTPQTGHVELVDYTSYCRDLADHLGAIPGVMSVSFSLIAPGSGMEFTSPISLPSSRAPIMRAVQEYIGPGFFHLLRMRILVGREFDWRDDKHTLPVAVISDSLARQLFGGQSPVGETIILGDGTDRKTLHVVGVSNNASLWRVQHTSPMAVYIPLMQFPNPGGFDAEMRTAGSPMSVAKEAGRTVTALGQQYSLRTQSLDDRQLMFLGTERMLTILSLFFATLAVLLAMAGMYGITSYAVIHRRGEMGVRLALGAVREQILALVIGDAVKVVVAGVALGVPAALLTVRILRSTLFVSGANVLCAVVAGAITLLMVSALSAFIPARRASGVDPVSILRE